VQGDGVIVRASRAAPPAARLWCRRELSAAAGAAGGLSGVSGVVPVGGLVDVGCRRLCAMAIGWVVVVVSCWRARVSGA